MYLSLSEYTVAYQAIKQVSFFPAVKMIRPKRKKFAIFSSKPFSERTIIEIVLETLSFVSKKQFLSLFTVGFSLDIILWLNRFIVVQNWCQNHLGVLKWECVNQTNGISLLEVIYPLKENNLNYFWFRVLCLFIMMQCLPIYLPIYLHALIPIVLIPTFFIPTCLIPT